MSSQLLKAILKIIDIATLKHYVAKSECNEVNKNMQPEFTIHRRVLLYTYFILLSFLACIITKVLLEP